MTGTPAWITAWERGFAAGTAARENGDREWLVDFDEDDGALLSISSYLQGYSDGFNPDREITTPGSNLAFALLEVVGGAVLTARAGRVAGGVVGWLVLEKISGVAAPPRPSTRAETPPVRSAGVTFATAWQWGRRRTCGRHESAWTTIGMSLPLVFAREHRRRRDRAAWHAYWSTRPA